MRSDGRPSDLSTRRRFLNGLARQVEADPELLLQPGTSVFARDDRAGTGVLVCYWADRHAIVWCDPEVDPTVDQLVDPDRTIDEAALGQWCMANNLELQAMADMRVLPGPPNPPGVLPPDYRQHWLRADDPDHVDLVRALADRCDPEDVEEAGLEDLDNFAEKAINVLTAGGVGPGTTADGIGPGTTADGIGPGTTAGGVGPGTTADGVGPGTTADGVGPGTTAGGVGEIVAYASAAEWSWDAGFADIGVLVDPAHRGLGLGRFVVAATTARLLADGALPLYRHGHANAGSKAIAVRTGFEPATTLAFYGRPGS